MRGVFVAALAKNVRLGALVVIGVGGVVDGAGEFRRDAVVGRAEMPQFGGEFGLVGAGEGRVEGRQTFAALTFCPILTATERTTEVSSGWITISLSLVTIRPLALTTMSTLATASAAAAAATSPAISQSTMRRFGGAASTLSKS